MSQTLIADFERLIRRDPARRGLVAEEDVHGPLCEGHLREAAVHLAEHAEHAAIVTGFFVPHGEPPAAETDGPLGALMLARALEAVGCLATILTDEHCLGALQAGAEVTGFARERIVCTPQESSTWLEAFFSTGPGRTITHLVAIERVGPSHTPQSLAQQVRSMPVPLQEFQASVPAEAHDRCHNMRGDVIDTHTADVHRLFEDFHRWRPAAKTIGVGDGANEIGMGVIPWEDLRRRIPGEHAARIPCRITTDWNIVAGTSNWGGYALAAALLLLRGRCHLLSDWDGAQQLRILEHMVEHGPAVDGVTGRREATVDALPFATFIQPWEGIRRLVGLGR